MGDVREKRAKDGGGKVVSVFGSSRKEEKFQG
jgi:hypothetical protein